MYATGTQNVTRCGRERKKFAFKILITVGDREARNWKTVPQTKKETINIE